MELSVECIFDLLVLITYKCHSKHIIRSISISKERSRYYIIVYCRLSLIVKSKCICNFVIFTLPPVVRYIRVFVLKLFHHFSNDLNRSSNRNVLKFKIILLQKDLYLLSYLLGFDVGLQYARSKKQVFHVSVTFMLAFMVLFVF